MKRVSSALPYASAPGTKIDLTEIDPRADGGLDKKAAKIETDQHTGALDELTYRLYAESKRSVLVVLQGIDTSGKDGVIRRALQSIDPLSCQITSFKRPTEEELGHDFLWRIHKAAPRRGNVGIFNRSHYEDVGVVRVHGLVSAEKCRERFEQINQFEQLLSKEGTRIVKFFLHISRKEQAKRLQSRLDDPQKRWKFNPDDLKERELWDKYMEAYSEALTACNTEQAPWYVVPADHNWYRNLVVSRVLHAILEEMNPKFPEPVEDLDDIKIV